MARLPRHSTRSRVTVGLIAVALAAVVAATGFALGANVHARTSASPSAALPEVAAAVEAARHGKHVPAAVVPPFATVKLFPRQYRIPQPCIAHDQSPKTTSRVCRVGQVSSKRLIVLFGDSHAFMWLPAVLRMAKRDGWAVVPLIRFGCLPGNWFTSRGPDACRAWFRWGIREIRALDPTVTLIGGSIGELPSYETSAATDGMIAAAKLLKPVGPLVVIGDPEGLANDPTSCVYAPGALLSSCMTTWPASSLAAYDRVARATRPLGVGFLRTRGFVCYQRQCPALVGHTIVWMDNSHLTGIYSAQVEKPFRAAFLSASAHAGAAPLPQ